MSRFSIETAPTDKACVYIKGKVRISVISDRIVRVEYSPKSHFTDKPTQTVICRNFAKPRFNITENGNKAIILTKSAKFIVDIRSLKTVCEINGKTVRASDFTNLGGTARTLDGTIGIVNSWKLKGLKDSFFIANFRKGIMSKNGVSEIDDSKTFVLEPDGFVSEREKGIKDKYVFAFGDDYLGGLKEFYALTGYTPVLPKYVLGNWWSRYHAYSDREYLALTDEFAKRNVPLTVATIDMDWHIVDDVPADCKTSNPFQSNGWTGYTFNGKLFPDYKAFLKSLKDRGLAVTMNLHPRDGVRYYETQYKEMARACGINPESKKPVEFDLTDKKFLYAYFDVLHHPYERDGVDFWWIDWQQGTKSKMKGLDPLWLLNHYHTLDIRRDGRDGAILSRYAGLGSHRYPIGFSGDTIVCWNSLKLQPWFTAMASNAGYTWWSHDIGGHMYGKGNEELYLRWLQFGVFSPINRLHSTNFGISKEPWLYPAVEKTAEDFLRLRHRLLPYLYTANVRTAKEGVPLVAPLYYYCKDDFAYSKKYREEYYFGSEMLVAAIVKKSKNGVSFVKIRFPEGEWTDFFTGEKFTGNKEYVIERGLSEYPVFVKKGGIVPMLSQIQGNSQLFDELEVRVYAGDNEYTMYDEQGSIEFRVKCEGENLTFCIKPSSECTTKRIKVVFCDINCAKITAEKYVEIDNNSVTVDCAEQMIKVELSKI